MAGSNRNGREAYWRAVLKRHAVSGLSVKAFCRREKIRESTYYRWRRTIRQRDENGKLASEEPAFVPAVVTDESVGERSITMELASGHVLRLPLAINASWIAELIHAIDGGGGQ